MGQPRPISFPPAEVQRLILEAFKTNRFEGPADARDIAAEIGLDLSLVRTSLSTMAWAKPKPLYRKKIVGAGKTRPTFHYMISEEAWAAWEKRAVLDPEIEEVARERLATLPPPKEHVVPSPSLDSMIKDQEERVRVLRQKLRDAEGVLELLAAVRSGKIVREEPVVD